MRAKVPLAPEYFHSYNLRATEIRLFVFNTSQGTNISSNL